MSSKKEHEKIGMTVQTTSDFTKQSTEHSIIANDFEKRLFTSLLLGSGAALVFLLSWNTPSQISVNFDVIRIISAWLFAISLFLTFASGFSFSVYSWKKSDEFTERRNLENCRNTNFETRKKIQKILLTDTNYLSFSKEERFVKMYDDEYLLSSLQGKTEIIIREQFERERTLPKSIAKFEKLAQRWLGSARILIGFALSAFSIGILYPLILMSREVFC